MATSSGVIPYTVSYTKLMNIQKKIVRLMSLKIYFDRTEPIYQELQILNIYEVNYFLTSLFMYRYSCLQNLPENFINYFLTNKEREPHLFA